MKEHIPWVAIVGGLLLFLAVLLLICRRCWRDYSRLTGQTRYKYRITDLYAFVIGMTPTMLAARYLSDLKPNPEQGLAMVLLIVAMAAAQVSGMFILSLEYYNRHDKSADAANPLKVSAWRSAMLIVLGGFVGLMMGGWILMIGVWLVMMVFVVLRSQPMAMLCAPAFVVVAWIVWQQRKKPAPLPEAVSAEQTASAPQPTEQQPTAPDAAPAATDSD